MAYDTSAVLSESELALRRRAVRFFWVVLIASSGASIIGNALHAVVHASSVSPVLAAAVATAPPLVLLGSTEGLSLLVKVRRRPTLTYWAALAMTLLLALAAFRLSFDALRDLAVLCGLRPSLAWLWPLVVDVTITQATVSLLALSRQAPQEDSTVDSADGGQASVVAMVPAQRELATGRTHAAGRKRSPRRPRCARGHGLEADQTATRSCPGDFGAPRQRQEDQRHLRRVRTAPQHRQPHHRHGDRPQDRGRLNPACHET